MEAVDKKFFGIVSGGQTGADRGAIDAAIEMGVPYCGWCPAGRLAEDGVIPNYIKLTETNSTDYLLRTEVNVAFAGSVVVFTGGPLDGGSFRTVEFAKKQGKPYLWLDLNTAVNPAALTLQFLLQYPVRYLMVAGNRESKAPGLQRRVKEVMMSVFARLP